jgi:thiol-disulfide isomerase/thioredoxin
MTVRITRRGALVAAGSTAVLVGGGLVLYSQAGVSNSIAEQAKRGDQKGYLSGDGTIETIAAADRAEPVDLAGTLLDGARWSSRDARGKVVVVNVWASWCAPCIEELPALQQVWRERQAAKAPVRFVGINFRDGVAQGSALARRAGLTYPSLSDEAGVLILALQGKAPSVPTTLVLDRSGRIASRVSGPVTATLLGGLVDDAVSESP